MTPDRIVLGTRNARKVAEIRAGLLGASVALDPLPPGAPEVEESGRTFAANARRKAEILSRWTGGWVLADDSGLEVDALGGAPGVLSHRWAGEPPDDERNNDRLLRELAGVPAARRGASFRCALALARAGAVVAQAEGACRGEIAAARRGANDFGYDPLFVHPPGGRTFAEMSAAEKLDVSHRGAALREMARLLHAGVLVAGGAR